MRCLSCDCSLSDKEAVRKSLVTQEYIDLCDNCFSYIKDEVLVVNPPKGDDCSGSAFFLGENNDGDENKGV